MSSLIYGCIDIMSKNFKLLPMNEQAFIILTSQEFLWNTMRENIQKKVIEMWEYDLCNSEVITYTSTNNKSVFIIEKGRDFHQILVGIGGTTIHYELPCGCECLFNEIIQQLLLVEPHNECQEHKKTFRRRK